MLPKDPRKRYGLLAASLVLIGLTFGCSPSSLSMLLLPFMDDKAPPRCKLAKKREEVTVVLYSSFAKGEIPLEMESAAGELTDVVAGHLSKRYAANKEKVTIVPPSRVRSFLNNRLGQAVTDLEIGEHFKADYVICLEIHSVALYEPRSYKRLFRGQAEVAVTVTDAKAPEGEGRVLSDVYTTTYPATGPIDVEGSSALQFRTIFFNKVGRDLSRWFAAYPKEEARDMD